MSSTTEQQASVPAIEPKQHHEFADLFPSMDSAEFEQLKVDIKANGQLTPITLLEGKVIDGRHREKACIELGIEPIYHEFEGKTDPLAFVVSSNLVRRHMDIGQRAITLGRVANIRHGGVRARGAEVKEVEGQEAVSQKEAADRFNLSEKTAQFGVKVVNKGIPELVDAVNKKDGMAVSVAAKIADLPPEEQRTVLKAKAPTEALRNLEKQKKEVEQGKAVRKEAVKQGRKVYGLIYADNLPFGDKDESFNLRALRPPVANDAVLYLWTKPPHLYEAMQMMTNWQFVYCDNHVWHQNDTTAGEWTRHMHMICLIGKRGNPAFPVVVSDSCFISDNGMDDMVQTIDMGYPSLDKLQVFGTTQDGKAGWDTWDSNDVAVIIKETKEREVAAMAAEEAADQEDLQDEEENADAM